MKVAVVIPARLGSTRLLAKPLLRETGKYLIQHVVEQARQARGVDLLVVATDSAEIAEAVASFGGQTVMTDPDHQSGTDRIAEVARSIDHDIVINLQGDEPLTVPEHIEKLVARLRADDRAQIATAATPCRDEATYRDPARVKVVLNNRAEALYFSRSPVPHCRDGAPDFAAESPLYLTHLGIYAYRRDYLLKFPSLPPHPLEMTERLEQLRALADGAVIAVEVVDEGFPGIDTPADYRAFVDHWNATRK